MFPNPSNGNFTVDINANDVGNVSLNVYSLMGEKVFGQTSTISSPTQLSVNLSSQPAGLYFLEIRNENSKAVKKIIIGN